MNTSPPQPPPAERDNPHDEAGLPTATHSCTYKIIMMYSRLKDTIKVVTKERKSGAARLSNSIYSLMWNKKLNML